MIREETGDTPGRPNGTGSIPIKSLSRGEAGHSLRVQRQSCQPLIGNTVVIASRRENVSRIDP